MIMEAWVFTLSPPIPGRSSFNNLYANAPYDLYNDTSSPIDGRYNYWGLTTISEMSLGGGYRNIAAIFDLFDNGSKGVVNYLPWRSSPMDASSGLLSRITDPASGDTLGEGGLTIQGIARASAGLEKVQVSIDGGLSWKDAAADRGILARRFGAIRLMRYTKEVTRFFLELLTETARSKPPETVSPLPFPEAC